MCSEYDSYNLEVEEVADELFSADVRKVHGRRTLCRIFLQDRN